MWLVVLLVVLAIVTGVFGALIEGLLWLLVISFLLLFFGAVAGFIMRGRAGSGGPATGPRT